MSRGDDMTGLGGEFIKREMELDYPNNSSQPTLRVILKRSDAIRIFEYVKCREGREVVFRMLVDEKFNDNGIDFEFHDLIFVKHKSYSQNYDADGDDISKIMDELGDNAAKMRAIFHSHPFGCVWSSGFGDRSDEKNIERQNNGDYLIFVVLSIQNDRLCYNCRIEIYPKPNAKNVRDFVRKSILNVPIKVRDNIGDSFDFDKAREEIKKIAEEKSIPAGLGPAVSSRLRTCPNDDW